MYVQYGNVFLRVIEPTRFERETLWTEDGTDLIGIDLKLGWLCTFSPGGLPALDSTVQTSPETKAIIGDGETDRTANVLTTNPRGANPGATNAIFTPLLESAPGIVTNSTSAHTGPETDAELRGRLWLPRQQLIVWAYARQTGQPIQWICSPRPGMSRDLDNGPKPLSVDIVSVQGEPNSATIHFQVQTVMSPCPTGSDRLVLAHRWEMTHRPDENHYLTRVIDGTIVFNGPALDVTGLTPDEIRNQFLHPIPLGFQRKPPVVTSSTDGLTIKYHLEDFDPTIVFDPFDSGVTVIEIAEKVGVSNPAVGSGLPFTPPVSPDQIGPRKWDDK